MPGTVKPFFSETDSFVIWLADRKAFRRMRRDINLDLLVSKVVLLCSRLLFVVIALVWPLLVFLSSLLVLSSLGIHQVHTPLL